MNERLEAEEMHEELAYASKETALLSFVHIGIGCSVSGAGLIDDRRGSDGCAIDRALNENLVADDDARKSDRILAFQDLCVRGIDGIRHTASRRDGKSRAVHCRDRAFDDRLSVPDERRSRGGSFAIGARTAHAAHDAVKDGCGCDIRACDRALDRDRVADGDRRDRARGIALSHGGISNINGIADGSRRRAEALATAHGDDIAVHRRDRTEYARLHHAKTAASNTGIALTVTYSRTAADHTGGIDGAGGALHRTVPNAFGLAVIT